MEPRRVKTIAFLSFLFPFLIAVVQNYFNELSSLAHPNFLKSAKLDDWTVVGTLNGVRTYMKANENSPLVTYRAVSVLNVHIGDAIDLFMNNSATPEWYPNMNTLRVFRSRTIPKQYESTTEKLLIGSKLPSPFAARIFKVQRSVHFSPDYKNVVVNQTSIPWDVAVTQESIEGHLNYSNWIFQDMEEYCREYLHTVNSNNSIDVSGSTSAATLPVGIPSESDDKAADSVQVKVVVKANCSMKFVCKWYSFVNAVSDWLIGPAEETTAEDASAGEAAKKRKKTGFKTSSEFSHLCNTSSSSSSSSNSSSSGSLGFAVDPTIGSSSNTGGRKKRTLLVIETLYDAGGSLPHWFVSYMHSMTWPHRTVLAFRKHLAAVVDTPARASDDAAGGRNIRKLLQDW